MDEFDNIAEAYNQGHDIIEHLKTTCLLKSVGFDQVKMQDVIRAMALWLATVYSGNKNKILVEENDIMEAHQVSKWKEAQCISLSMSSLKELIIPPSFPNLLTLIVRRTPWRLFQVDSSISFIKVLDLSFTQITELPVGIGKLVTLQYLDLSGTNLRELSAELKTLKRIRYLLLHSMSYLKIISKEVILNLLIMRYFSMGLNHLLEEEKDNHSPKEEEPNYSEENSKAIYLWEDNKALLEDLEGLEYIYKLGIFSNRRSSVLSKVTKLSKIAKCYKAFRPWELGRYDLSPIA